ncbi:MAG: carboxypeptidase regulatory-like domain-containing protein [Bryobacterales bacterium]|nr:carboxypeptidase regulatory-like domain-containing protein [Bryobacterales bacterium]
MKRLAAVLFLATLPLAAQTSSLQGVISDAQGAVIPSAIVTVTNSDTSASRKEVTDNSGTFRFLQVIPGPYKIEVQKPGFKTKAANMSLQVDVPATLNVTLEVGETIETVNVTAEATQINTENATVGNPFTEVQVQQLPLQTRNVVALLSVQPGVSSTGQVLGARPDQNNVMLDGVDVNDNRGTTANNGFNAVLPIPLDSVQEFRTTIAGQGADLGHAAGGQVAIVTKGGTNQFHGSVYEYNRNTAFEANDWFSNRAGVPRPALIRNQYGASLGGPIVKNKLFFFFNWEARKDRSQAATTATVPSDSFKQGIVKVLLKSGQTVSLSPSDVKAIDPLGIGENSYMLSLMQQYPSGNNPLGASDKGLNFNSLLFNASQPLNNHAEVARMDYNIDNAGKHQISVRGTLNGASQEPTTGLALFPGQAPSQVLLDNSRGVAARYTYVIAPNMVNVFNYGYTRLGTSSTGTEAVVPSFGFTTLTATTRPSTRIAPTPNYTDDFTWTRGRHTIQAGMNFRQAQNITTSGANVPSYRFNRNTLLGLGNDITAPVLAYIQQSAPGAALSSTTNVANAFGAMFGMLNNASAIYNFGINGQAVPFGQPLARNYISNSPEEYVQDTWKALPNLTITAGLRYSIYGVPYEANGVQVVPQTSINQYFADRGGAALAGIPNYAVPTSYITYIVGGPVNKGPAFYPTDHKDWAPRLGIAYSPKGGSWLERIMGKGSVFRTGAGIVYDNYGNGMAAAFANNGSPGLATSVAQPVNTNYSTALRYNGSAYPALSAATGGMFPYTPPLVTGGFTTFTGVSNDLKAPYEYVLNAHYARPLPKHMSIEVGYAGRLAHRALVQQDIGQPLEQFVDPKSGQSLAQASAVLANLYNTGLTPAQVKANPNLVPLLPFIQNMFPGASGLYIPGSASANLFYDAYNVYAGSWTDTINDMDRIRQPNGKCIVIFGCNTFFPTQNSGVLAYTNAGKSAYHAMTISLRRTLSSGWGYDFNYTWSHAIDNASGAEGFDPTGTSSNISGFASGISDLQNGFCPNCSLGPAEYDARHQITADAVAELPFGKGKHFVSNASTWLDEVIGGWQVSMLYSFHTGNPLNCSASGIYNTNYLNSSYCTLAPGVTSIPTNGLAFDQLGIPSIFSNTNASYDFVPAPAGAVGYRGIFRGPGFWNTDVAVSKFFKLPKENMQLQLRGEAYNIFNHENFANPGSSGNSNLSITQQPGLTTAGTYAAYGSATFGEITSTNPASAPRVLQVALRFTF